jgi:sarcosine oxidase delta subunit
MIEQPRCPFCNDTMEEVEPGQPYFGYECGCNGFMKMVRNGVG